jgi:hypothetical protein
MTDSTHRFERDRLFKKWGQFNLIKTGDLEHKTVFRDESKMIAALLAYNTDAEKLASICAKINVEYATEITLEKIGSAQTSAIDSAREEDKDLNQKLEKLVMEKPAPKPSWWQRLMSGPSVSPAASSAVTNIKTTTTNAQSIN